eukprot:gene3302-3787_t
MFQDQSFIDALVEFENPDLIEYEFFNATKDATMDVKIYRKFSEYTYIRESRESVQNDTKTWVILAKSHTLESIPPKRKVIRVNDYHQFMVLQDTTKNTTQAYMHYYDNPKGMLPTWLINWAAKTGVPSFLKSMKKACDNYEEYKEKKGC